MASNRQSNPLKTRLLVLEWFSICSQFHWSYHNIRTFIQRATFFVRLFMSLNWNKFVQHMKHANVCIEHCRFDLHMPNYCRQINDLRSLRKHFNEIFTNQLNLNWLKSSSVGNFDFLNHWTFSKLVGQVTSFILAKHNEHFPCCCHMLCGRKHATKS